MDASSSSQTSRLEPPRNDSGGMSSRSGDKDIVMLDARSVPSKPTPEQRQRATRYKEKFQALREKYDQVTTTHDQYKRELAIAEEKARRLQAECNLLLDAVDIAVPAQPTLLHYLARDPIPPQYHSYTSIPIPPRDGASSPSPAIQSLREHHQRAANGQGPIQTVVMPDVGPLCPEDAIPEDVRRMNHQFMAQMERR